MATTAVVDLLALGTALTLATATRFGSVAIESQSAYGKKMWLWLLLWWVSLGAAGLYNRARTDNRIEELRHIVNGVTLGAAVAITGSFFVRFSLSRIWAVLVWLLGLILVIAGRTAIRWAVQRLRIKGHLRRRAVVVGADETAHRLVNSVRQASWEGVDVVGLVSVGGVLAKGVDDLVIGQVEDLREVVIGTHATEVLVAPSVAGTGRFSDVVAALDGLPVELRMAPGLEGFLASRLTVHPLGDRALVAVERVELQPAAKVFKRALDLALSSMLCLLSLPVLAVCAIAIRLESKGPIFFKQVRIGAGGSQFKVWKLRSMVVDAERKLDELKHRNEAEGLLFKLRDDPRVTKVGKFLRRTSLDELPQLFNVLAGDMSLVGPRPPLPAEVAQYDSPLRRRLLVKPGITGLWQVSGRSEASFDDYVRYDLLYVQNWSPALDVLILLKTIPSILTSRGAY